MSTERNELADEMTGWTVSSGYYGQELGSEVAQEIAEHLIKAGYRKPRTVTTKGELDNLGNGALIRTHCGEYREAAKLTDGDNVWRTMGPAKVLTSKQLEAWHLPATVLHEGATNA